MTIDKLNVVSFTPTGKDSFHETVIARVNAYFTKNNISPYANTKMWVKTIAMLLLYFLPYTVMATGLCAGNVVLFFGCWIIMGLGLIGIGTSVMHDANHGSYSANGKVNTFIGYILEIIGGYAVTWKIQHNQLHHTYTNISGLDEDIDNIKLLRFSPRQPRSWVHRFQFIYAWFFYMLMTLFWMTGKDYQKIIRYKKHGLLKNHNVSLKQALLRISVYKFFYYVYIMALPIVFSGMQWHYILIGFLLMHSIAGFFLSCIFQSAHIVETSAFKSPIETNGKKQMEESWAIHELGNTTNFAINNRLLTWFIGGLNFQIEHHLFAGVCHVHYPKLAPIVKAAADDFGIPYHVEPTFRQAIWEHMRMLKKLGRE